MSQEEKDARNEQMREQIADFNQHVNNTEWFSEFKEYLNNFETQLDLLDQQKEEFFEKTNKACKILNENSTPQRSPTKTATKQISLTTIEVTDLEKLPSQNFSLKFADEV